MNKKHIFLILTLTIFFTAANLLGMNYFSRKEIDALFVKILNNWLDNNILATIDYWYVPKDIPPVDNLATYQILNKSYDKKIVHHKAIYVTELTFKAKSPFFSSGRWIFEFEKTTIGWKVTRCVQPN